MAGHPSLKDDPKYRQTRWKVVCGPSANDDELYFFTRPGAEAWIYNQKMIGRDVKDWRIEDL